MHELSIQRNAGEWWHNVSVCGKRLAVSSFGHLQYRKDSDKLEQIQQRWSGAGALALRGEAEGTGPV